MSTESTDNTQNSEATSSTVVDDTTSQSVDSTEVTTEAGGQGTEDNQQGAVEYTDFSLPEGVTLNQEALNGFTPILQKAGVDQDTAQELVDAYAKQQADDYQRQLDEFEDLKENWLNDTKNDKEIGGDNFDKSVSDAMVAIDKLGTPELRQLLEEHGVGNHPEVVRVFAKMGALLREDSGEGSTTPIDSEKALPDRFYS